MQINECRKEKLLIVKLSAQLFKFILHATLNYVNIYIYI